MYHVVPGEVVHGPSCECCGMSGRSAYGFVHRGESAVAFYYAWMEPAHGGRKVSVAISVGDWDPGHEAGKRWAAALQFEAQDGEISAVFTEPEASPYSDRSVLGTFLSAGEASESVLRSKFLEVAEVIIREDPSVNTHLV